MSISLQNLESSSEENPAFLSHAGVQSLAVRMMMQAHLRVPNGYREITQAQIDELGYAPGDVKRSFVFDGTGEGREIFAVPVEDEVGSLLWTDAIIAVERALSMGLLPNQVYAYYIKGKLIVTLSYKVLVAWASMKRSFNVYHYPMTDDERMMHKSKYGKDSDNDLKVWAYLVDKENIAEIGRLSLKFMDRGMTFDKAREMAIQSLWFARGAGILREFEIKGMADNSYSPEKKVEKRATVAAITGVLGEPTFFEIRSMQDDRTLETVAAISAGEVVNVPPHIPAGEAENRYIKAELHTPVAHNHPVDGVTLMRGPVEEDYID